MIRSARKLVKSKLEDRILPHILARALYECPKPDGYHDTEDMEDCFKTADGRSVPVLKHHRYGLKKCWDVLGPLAALHELDRKGLLDSKTKGFLKKAIGYRTPTVPMAEVREVLSPFLEKHEDLFLSTQIPDMGRRLLKPVKSEVEKLISLRQREHRETLDKITSVSDVKWGKGSKVLEIGYTSGGESLIAFERMGFEACGLDNFYEDNFHTNSRHEEVRKLAGARTEFLIGDITEKTPVAEGATDLIYTQSVLEHIRDLPAAFSEMYRILRPGWIMYHRYDPYFYIRGAHSQSTLDSPWAHMRLGQEDVEKYIRKFRPHEADITLPWIRSALNRRHTQAFVQSCLAQAGFEILWWQSRYMPPEQARYLTPGIISECLSVNPGVSLGDLLSCSVAFIARKKGDGGFHVGRL